MLRPLIALAAAAALSATAPPPKNPCVGAPSDVTIAGPDEPGERIVVEGRVLRADGRSPAPGVTVYAYQTDADGLYSKVRGTTPRLRGWATTDADGWFTFRTIRPAPYPSRTIPAHLHFHLWGGGAPPQWSLDVFFDDDPLVTEAVRARSSGPGAEAVVRKPVRKAEGVWRVDHEIVLKERPDRFSSNIRHGLDPCGVVP